jgi:hypothetical protein
MNPARSGTVSQAWRTRRAKAPIDTALRKREQDVKPDMKFAAEGVHEARIARRSQYQGLSRFPCRGLSAQMRWHRAGATQAVAFRPGPIPGAPPASAPARHSQAGRISDRATAGPANNGNYASVVISALGDDDLLVALSAFYAVH